MKKLFTSLMLLMFAFVMNAQNAIYTLDTTERNLQGTNNSYAGNCDIKAGELTWNVNGNTQQSPWRIGGKSLSGVDRTVKTTNAFGKAVSKVVLTLGSANGITVNSVKLSWADNADFTNAKSITKDYATSIEFAPEGEEIAADSYYKFDLNVTVAGTDNKYVTFNQVELYSSANSTEPEIIGVNEVTFGTVLVGTKKTIKVLGANLTEAITAELEGGWFSNFEIDETELTAEGGTITVNVWSYAQAGPIEDNLILTSGETTKTIHLTATVADVAGAGTKGNPLTVGDVLSLDNTMQGTYWVSGYIIGAIDANKGTIDNTNNTNLVIGATPDAESGSWVSVQLPSGAARTALNVKDNPENIGKFVKLYGSLEKYCNMPGVKSVSDYQIVVPSTVTFVDAEGKETKLAEGAKIESASAFVVNAAPEYDHVTVRVEKKSVEEWDGEVYETWTDVDLVYDDNYNVVTYFNGMWVGNFKKDPQYFTKDTEYRVRILARNCEGDTDNPWDYDPDITAINFVGTSEKVEAPAIDMGVAEYTTFDAPIDLNSFKGITISFPDNNLEDALADLDDWEYYMAFRVTSAWLCERDEEDQPDYMHPIAQLNYDIYEGAGTMAQSEDTESVTVFNTDAVRAALQPNTKYVAIIDGLCLYNMMMDYMGGTEEEVYPWMMSYWESIFVYFETDTTVGIKNVQVAKGDKMFNLAGQRVNNAKGIVIKDGKKYVVK